MKERSGKKRSPVLSRLATGGPSRSGHHKTQLQRTGVGVGVLTAIVGFLLVTQASSVKDLDDQIASQPPAEIGRIVSNLSAEKDRLRDEIVLIERALSESRSIGKRNSTLNSEASRARNDYSVAAGAAAVTGHGISLHISDPEGSLRALDISDLVRELYAAGAESVAFGSTRVTTLSSFEDADGVVIDGVSVPRPYAVSAIGDPALLMQAMTMPGGYLDVAEGLEGVDANAKTVEELRIPAAIDREFQYASSTPGRGKNTSRP